jgi:hypothetical protein
MTNDTPSLPSDDVQAPDIISAEFPIVTLVGRDSFTLALSVEVDGIEGEASIVVRHALAGIKPCGPLRLSRELANYAAELRDDMRAELDEILTDTIVSDAWPRLLAFAGARLLAGMSASP